MEKYDEDDDAIFKKSIPRSIDDCRRMSLEFLTIRCPNRNLRENYIYNRGGTSTLTFKKPMISFKLDIPHNSKQHLLPNNFSPVGSEAVFPLIKKILDRPWDHLFYTKQLKNSMPHLRRE